MSWIGKKPADTVQSAQALADGTVTPEKVATGAGYTFSFPNVSYTGTLTGGTGVINIGSGQFYKDASGNLGLGVTPSAWGSAYKAIDFGSYGAVSSNGGNTTFFSNNAYVGASGWIYKTSHGNGAQMIGMNPSGAGGIAWFVAPAGTAGNGITFKQVLTIYQNSQVDLTSAQTAGSTNTLFTVQNASGGDFVVEAMNNNIPAISGVRVAKLNSTGRSINCAGTVNQNGADYAEYMVKSGDFVVSKGDVVGIDANGKLTNVYADAVSFCVKSTDPGLVGGDKWFTEPRPKNEDGTEVTSDTPEYAAWHDRMEEARAKVDRIAFCGQVPVNVMSAAPGQYIVPVNDNGSIKGEAVSNPTFEQYQLAVGKVIAIEEDGRARIIVKVA